MCQDVGGAGAWQRAFNRGTAAQSARYLAPTVEGVDFPTIGLSQAINDTETGVLTVSTYAATPSKAGEATQFRVVQLPAAAGVEVAVSRDGEAYSDWELSADGQALTIRTTVPVAHEHTFEIFTGYRGAGESTADAFTPRTVSHGAKARL